MKLLIAIDEDRGVNSKLSLHFGHCPYFAIYETKTKKLSIIKNDLDHLNKSLTPVDQVMKFNLDIVFSLGIGQRAIKLFNEKNIKLKTGNFKTLKEVIGSVNNLDELNKGCIH